MSGEKELVHFHNGILLGHKKEIVRFVTAWMDLKSIMLSEISQSEKDKYHLYMECNEQNKLTT
jgi:hypothetical protein